MTTIYVEKGTDWLDVPGDCFLIQFSGSHWLPNVRGKRTLYATVRRSSPAALAFEALRDAPIQPGPLPEGLDIVEVHAFHGQWRDFFTPGAAFPIDLAGMQVYRVWP
jgi:hypothetical protein